MTLTYVDPVKALRDWMRDLATAATLTVDPDRVNLGTIAGDESQITVRRVAGGDDTSEAPLDRCQVQVDVWHGTSYNTCSNLTLQVRAALRSLRSQPLNSQAHGYGAEVLNQIFLPDEEGKHPRYALTVLVVSRAL